VPDPSKLQIAQYWRAAYAKLAEKSRLVPIAYYSAVEPRLFDSIIAKYTHAHQAPAASPPPAEPARR